MPYQEETEEQKKSARRLLLVLLGVLAIGLLTLAGQLSGLIKI